MLRIYDYRRRLPHYQKDNHALFVTFRKLTFDPFPPEARSLVLDHCLHDHGRRIQLHAAVVMPEHVHLLFSALRDAEGFLFCLPEILRAIKGSSARTVNRLMRTSGRVWQDESFDHVLRHEESMQQKIEYIRQNAVRRGFVSRPEDYPWLWIETASVARALLPAMAESSGRNL